MTWQGSGVVVIDKAVGPSSFDVVREARRLTGVRKIGHGGTLDPLASGVLPICFNEATKLAQFLLSADKEYDATIRFGAATDTYDSAGQVVETRPAAHLTVEAVRAALARFVGPQSQVPPVYSALKQDGQRLYRRAREGTATPPPPRPVVIHELALLGFDEEGTAAPVARVHVHCAKGTYVRSLAHDLGQALGTGAHLAELRRTRSGPFTLAQAVAVASLGDPDPPLISLAHALAHLPAVVLGPDQVTVVRQGKRVTWRDIGIAAAPIEACRLMDLAGDLVAVAEPAIGLDERLRTARVFCASEPALAAIGHN